MNGLILKKMQNSENEKSARKPAKPTKTVMGQSMGTQMSSQPQKNAIASQAHHLNVLSQIWESYKEEFNFSFDDIKSQSSITGVLSGLLPFFLTQIEEASTTAGVPVLFIAPDDLTASRIYEQCLFLAENCPKDNSQNNARNNAQNDSGNNLKTTPKGDQKSNQKSKEQQAGHFDVLFFPSWGILPFTYSKPDPKKEAERAKTLSSLLLDDQPKLIVTSVDALIQKFPDKKTFYDKMIHFKTHDTYDFEKVLSLLVEMGYTKEDIVQNYGQFCVKGNIIDVFSPLYFNPIRFDFFGNDLERIVLFDPDTQKSLSTLTETKVFPCHDLTITENDMKNLHKAVDEEFTKTKKTLPPFCQLKGDSKDRVELGGVWDLFPLVFETSTLFDFFSFKDSSKRPLVFLWEKSKIEEQLYKIENEIGFLRNRNENKIMLKEDSLFLSPGEFLEKISGEIELSAIPKETEPFRFSVKHSPVYKGRVSGFIEDIKSGTFKNKKIYVSVKSQIQFDRLEHIVSGYRSQVEPLNILEAPFDTGFEAKNFVLITEKDLFGKSSRISRLQKGATSVIQSFTDLKTGDYVVHVNYGIGKFQALKRMQVAGFERDFIEIEYAENNKLYVPIEQLSFVHKYIGSTDNPALDHLGKKSGWSKTKGKVSESVEKMALELLEIYAKREKMAGICFPSDSRYQEEFEAGFPFEETEHQLQTINEVKKDMEGERPMDRLVCGDVGFGKTEVAIRAAFKAVMAGRQVCLLCPTTILAFQHYNTFKSRFENYPVKIELMSRFKTQTELTKIKKSAQQGEVDIVIGTQALLSKEMQWKNLGLLVIDEEQRFGVKHKEYIKSLKSNVDCLTMTATPIPRTLQMSLIGIRDLSIIETPPRNRLKIETYVLENNDEILKRAIQQEIERGGQVIIIHNKVQTIEVEAAKIQNLVPSADILILHGQLSEDEIEIRTLDFYAKKYNVLVSTTIVESGIDLPSANTLIVLNAQNFGLSQLYQIKGRVGRSDVQAYAYFFYPAGQIINANAEKRLNTLMEYDGLGDGFKIAMKDLEIRGAGNILGAEQSGDIMAVGFELYVKMLEEKLRELKNEVKPGEFECTIVVPQDYYIPDSYIADTRQKMEFYKKLASVTELHEIEELMNELSDRFGSPPESVESMFEQEKLRLMAKMLRFEKVVFQNKLFSFTASPEFNADTKKLIQLIQKDQRFKPDPREPKKLNFMPQSGDLDLTNALKEINAILAYLI